MLLHAYIEPYVYAHTVTRIVSTFPGRLTDDSWELFRNQEVSQSICLANCSAERHAVCCECLKFCLCRLVHKSNEFVKTATNCAQHLHIVSQQNDDGRRDWRRKWTVVIK